MFGILEILIGLISVLSVIWYYYYLTANYNFWKLRGVPGPKPRLIFGNVIDLVRGKYSIGCFLRKVYEENRDKPLVGLFVSREPILVVQDMDLIKAMMIKDFTSFMDRGMGTHEHHDPLTMHLFNLEPKRWRSMRARLTPVFTSGKLRDMFYLLIQCGDQLNKYLAQISSEPVDMREIAAKFAIDVIGVCVFGLQMNTLVDEDSLFRTMGKRIFHPSWKNLTRFRMRCFASKTFVDLFGKYLTDHILNDFFIKLTRDTLQYRKENNIVRHDFIELLKSLKEEPSKLGDMELTDELLAAQLFVFFIAGFETSSSTISNCLFELAMNPKVQDKLRREIVEELDKTDGELTYDGIKSMKYLDKTLKETVRKYPPVTFIMRSSTAAYTFPGTEISIPYGTKIWIPIFGIQRDPKYFPNPDAFEPERFSDEVIKSRHPMSFLSFGDGPRNCIGTRFGSMQTKVALVKILGKYSVNVCEKTDKEYKIDPRGFMLTPQSGIFLKIAQVQL